MAPACSWALLLGLVCACAAPRLGAEGVDPGLLPVQAAADPEAARGRRVRWGGVVLQVVDKGDSTDLEVLAYPLRDGGRPRTEAAPLGCFLARNPLHSDPADLAPGSRVTLVGRVAGTVPCPAGEAERVCPVLEVELLHRWTARYPAPAPRVHFGIGVILP
jgi:outer membrane lipoprotein